MSKKSRKLTELGEQIKVRLIMNGMKQKDLAKELGTSPQYVNKILHGERSGEKYVKSIRKILDMENSY